MWRYFTVFGAIAGIAAAMLRILLGEDVIVH
jgi:hypothetical protein